MLHLNCYYGNNNIGTTVNTLDKVFDYLERFFGWSFDKVVVVETGETLYNKGGQLELF